MVVVVGRKNQDLTILHSEHDRDETQTMIPKLTLKESINETWMNYTSKFYT